MKIEEIKEIILNKISEELKKYFGDINTPLFLESPPDFKFGDFAFCFSSFLKEIKDNPKEVFKNISENISLLEFVEKTEVVFPYINIKIKNEVLFKSVILEIENSGTNFGENEINKNKKILIEFLSPNTNKPLHLGHARNGVLGMAMSNILRSTGASIIKTNLVNDRGEHICKSMLAYKKWGGDETPESTNMKGDHFVGKWYVRYAKEEKENLKLKDEVYEMLKKWEAGDKEIISLWQKMNSWVYQGFNETYNKFGLDFDSFYYESETYKLGKDVILEGIKNGVFYYGKEGDVLFDLPEEEFGLNKDGTVKKITVLRKDGTSLYMTQDIGTAVKRKGDYGVDFLIHVVGSEQDYHFKCLFKILKELGFDWAKNCYHLSYGMVSLPDGKMKSREGNVIDIDNLIEEMQLAAKNEINSRKKEKEIFENIEERSLKIALSAIKFKLLSVSPKQDICFNPKESISFDGVTGPYCQYAYARASGIIKKAKDKGFILSKEIDFSNLKSKEEINLIHKLSFFPEEIKKASELFNPSKIANYAYDLSKSFNQFYGENPVLLAENENLILSRLSLVYITSLVIKKALSLIDIEVLEEM